MALKKEIKMENENDSLDLIGLGKIAKAIPEEVYTRSADVILTTFEKITAPITETTGGFGRYLRQKFDNMVNAEKAIATYTLEKAILKAKQKVPMIHPPLHHKSFVKALEESSKEMDPLLHELWTNLLASQLVEEQCHPHFVEILPHFSPAEAMLLETLNNRSDVGENVSAYVYFTYDSFRHWVRKTGDKKLEKWTYSCSLLCEFAFANILAPKEKMYDKAEEVTILYRTLSGSAFLNAVSP